MSSLRRALSRVRWYARGVTGADAYERYVSHLARVHPDAPVPGRSDFWRQRYAEQDARPGSRCC